MAEEMERPDVTANAMKTDSSPGTDVRHKSKAQLGSPALAKPRASFSEASVIHFVPDTVLDVPEKIGEADGENMDEKEEAPEDVDEHEDEVKGDVTTRSRAGTMDNKL